jgi:hypothetical protein
MKKYLPFLFIFISFNAAAIVNEIAFDFGYDRQIYGLERQNSNVTRTYSGALATYIFDYTAIDLNASTSQEITTENQRYAITTGLDLVGQQNRVYSRVFGVGIKQMFAPRTSRIIPGISIGYAKQFLEYQSDLTILNTTNNVRTIVSGGTTKQRVDSVFGTFSLQLRLTERLSLKASIKTLFPSFEMDKARDNVKFAAGFSWVF